MGGLLASKLLSTGLFRQKEVLVTCKDAEKLEKLVEQGATAKASNAEAVQQSDIVLLAVKPKDLPAVLGELRDCCCGKLVLSIAAGIKTATISAHLSGARILRAMPNINAFVGEAFTAIAPKTAADCDLAVASAIFGSIGRIGFFDENSMDALTAISGSGPGFLSLIMGAMAATLVQHGISSEDSRLIAAHTAMGTGKTIMESGLGFAELTALVASKKGTTEAGLEVASTLGLENLLTAVFERAIERAGELSNGFDEVMKSGLKPAG